MALVGSGFAVWINHWGQEDDYYDLQSKGEGCCVKFCSTAITDLELISSRKVGVRKHSFWVVIRFGNCFSTV